MSKKTEKAFAAIFSGIGGVILTLLCQYLWNPQPQSITFEVNGQELYVTQEDYLSKLSENEHLCFVNENLQAEIATLQDETTKLHDENIKLQDENTILQQEIGRLRQANNITNNSSGNSGIKTNSTGNTGAGNSSNKDAGTGDIDIGNTGIVNHDIKGTVRVRNNQNINGCPQVNFPEESQITDQTTYEMTWASFEGAATYRISIWKDANYGMTDSNIIFVNEVEVSGLSYNIDLTALEPGYTYGFNVVVDNHFSSPLLIELF